MRSFVEEFLGFFLGVSVSYRINELWNLVGNYTDYQFNT